MLLAILGNIAFFQPKYINYFWPILRKFPLPATKPLPRRHPCPFPTYCTGRPSSLLPKAICGCPPRNPPLPTFFTPPPLPLSPSIRFRFSPLSSFSPEIPLFPPPFPTLRPPRAASPPPRATPPPPRAAPTPLRPLCPPPPCPRGSSATPNSAQAPGSPGEFSGEESCMGWSSSCTPDCPKSRGASGGGGSASRDDRWSGCAGLGRD